MVRLRLDMPGKLRYGWHNGCFLLWFWFRLSTNAFPRCTWHLLVYTESLNDLDSHQSLS